MKSEWKKQPTGRQVDPHCFNCYHAAEVPSAGEWSQVVLKHVKLVLRMWAAHAEAPSSSSCRGNVIKRVHKPLSEITTNGGVLIVNYLMLLLSMLGLLPLWMKEEVVINPDCTWCRWMMEEYHLENFMRKPNALAQIFGTLKDVIHL